MAARPADNGAPPGPVTAFGYNDVSGDQVAVKAFTPVPLGGLVDVLWDAPVPVLAGVDYIAGWHTGRYAATGGFPWPAVTANLFTASAAAGRFTYSAGVTRPLIASAAAYHVSPLVAFGGEPVALDATLAAAGVLTAVPRLVVRPAAIFAAAGRLSATLAGGVTTPGVLEAAGRTGALGASGRSGVLDADGRP